MIFRANHHNGEEAGPGTTGGALLRGIETAEHCSWLYSVIIYLALPPATAHY